MTVNDMHDGHVALDIQRLDRIYLNAYVPLQTSAQVVAFLTGNVSYPFPSLALFRQSGDRFRRPVASYAQANNIPWIKFGKHDVGGKLEIMRPHLDHTGRHRPLRRRGKRSRAGVPAGLNRLRTPVGLRRPAVVVRQDRTASDRVLLLPVGHRLRPGVRQGLQLLPLPGQDLAQWPRVGQAASGPGQARVHRTIQRLRHHRRPRRAAGDLRPARRRRDHCVRQALAGPAAAALR